MAANYFFRFLEYLPFIKLLAFYTNVLNFALTSELSLCFRVLKYFFFFLGGGGGGGEGGPKGCTDFSHGVHDSSLRLDIL